MGLRSVEVGVRGNASQRGADPQLPAASLLSHLERKEHQNAVQVQLVKAWSHSNTDMHVLTISERTRMQL